MSAEHIYHEEGTWGCSLVVRKEIARFKWDTFSGMTKQNNSLREGVGYVKTQLSCVLFIMLTTCFGHCGPSSGHKNVYKGKLHKV